MSVLTGVNDALNTAIRFSTMRSQADYRDALTAKAETDVKTDVANQSYNNMRVTNLIDDVGELNKPAVMRVLGGEGSPQENLAVGSLFNNLSPEQLKNTEIGLSYDPKTKTVSAPTLTLDTETGAKTPGAITEDGSSDPNSKVVQLSVEDAYANLEGLYTSNVLSRQDTIDVDVLSRQNTLFRPEIARSQANLLESLEQFPEVQRGVLTELSRLERDEDKLEFTVAFELDYLKRDPQGVLLGIADNYDETSLAKTYEMVRDEGIQDPRQVSRLPIAKQIQVFAASVASMPEGEARNKAAARYGDLIQRGILGDQDIANAGDRLTNQRELKKTVVEGLRDFGKNSQAVTTAILENASSIRENLKFNVAQDDKEGIFFDDDNIEAKKSLTPVTADPKVITAMQTLLTDLEIARESGNPALQRKALTNLQDGVARTLSALGNQVTDKSLSPLPSFISALPSPTSIQGVKNWWNNREPGQLSIGPMGGRMRISENGNEYGIASVKGNSDIAKNPVPAALVAAIFGPELEQALRAELLNSGATF
jgi:hypothetical protein